MSKAYTILKRDSTSEGLLLEVLADDAAGFETLKSDFHDGRQLSPGTTVEVAGEQKKYRLLNGGAWEEVRQLSMEGGTDDYADLSNKPKINGVELSGDKTSADLKISAPTDEQVANAVEAWLDEHPEATSTVEDGSISTAKLAGGSVTPVKTSFINYDGCSANLFNKNATTDGYELETYAYVLKENASYCVSDFIPVEASTTYCRTFTGSEYKSRKINYFNSEKEYISAKNVSGTFTTPENCSYIRIELLLESKDIFVMVKGDTLPTEYVPYEEYYAIDESVAVKEGSLPKSVLEKLEKVDNSSTITETNAKINTAVKWNDVNQSTKTLTGRINVFENVVKGTFDIASDISDKTVIVHGVNYFDMNDLVPGRINTSNGNIETRANEYYTEHLIPVQPGKRLFFNRYCDDDEKGFYLIFHFYDADGNWLRRHAHGASANGRALNIDNDVHYIRVDIGEVVDVVNVADEMLCIADVDIGNTSYGNYDGNFPIESGGKTYFGKNVYFPYVGYRIENGVLIGASDTFTVEEITHVDVFDSASAIEVTAPVEGFDKSKLENVVLKYGRYADTDYTLARIFKSTITGKTITPKLVAFNPGGKTMNDLAKENDFVMAINAGVFNTDDNSCIGVVIADGVVVADHIDHVYSGAADVLAINSSGDLLSYAYETTTANMLSAGVVGAVSGKNTLITNYAKSNLDTEAEKLGDTSLITSKHPRTVIGQYKNGDYFVFTCGGRETNQAGMNCAEMQEILVNEGVKYAYNLDGGGSCNMMFYKKELAPHTENRAIPTYIVFN